MQLVLAWLDSRYLYKGHTRPQLIFRYFKVFSYKIWNCAWLGSVRFASARFSTAQKHLTILNIWLESNKAHAYYNHYNRAFYTHCLIYTFASLSEQSQQNQGAGGMGSICPPDFGRSVNSIATEGQIMPTTLFLGTPGIWTFRRLFL